jgi:hypothetical protein
MKLTTQGPRRFVRLAGIALLVLFVAACGRKSALSPPEDEAELYTYGALHLSEPLPGAIHRGSGGRRGG